MKMTWTPWVRSGLFVAVFAIWFAGKLEGLKAPPPPLGRGLGCCETLSHSIHRSCGGFARLLYFKHKENIVFGITWDYMGCSYPNPP